jgi:hypothetical protein
MFKLISVCVLLIFIVSQSMARENYRGYSGAPGRSTCANSCHGGSNGTVSLSGFPDLYNAGETYTLTISRDSGNSICNFNASCRLGTGTSNAGIISSGSGTTAYNVNGETNGVSLSSYYQTSATFDWTAPEAGSGQARLYIAAYQGSGTNGQTSDFTLIADEDIASEPDLGLGSWELIADGNSNGISEPAEEIELALTFENTGNATATSIDIELSTISPWANVIQGQASVQSLDPENQATADNNFVIQISSECQAIHQIIFNLAINCAEGNYSDELVLQIGERQIYWEDDLESEPFAWQHFALDEGVDQWHLSDADSNSPTHSWKFGESGTGDYDNFANGRLISSTIDLLPWSRLEFMHKIEAEISGSFPDSAYDGGFVEISTNDGFTWVQLQPIEGYNKYFRWLAGNGDPATHPFPGGTQCYSGEFDWQAASFDLEEYANQTVRFALHFGSDGGSGSAGWILDDFAISGYDDGTSIQNSLITPQTLSLQPAWPNPFNPSTNISYELRNTSNISAELFNLNGQMLRKIANRQRGPGQHIIRIDGNDLAAGIYIFRISTQTESYSQKLTLLK